MSVDVVRARRTTTVYVRGELDVATVELLHDAIALHVGGRQAIVVDLSGIDFMDGSAIRYLLQARAASAAAGGSLVLCNPSGWVRRLLALAGVEHLLTDAP